MIRKLLTSILCLLMALSLPLCSLAATQTTLTLIPGDDMAKEQIVKELADALAIQATYDDEAGALSILVSGESVLTIALRVAEDGLFAQSAILGEKPVYLSIEDIQALLKSVMEQSGADSAQIGQMFPALPTAELGSIAEAKTGSLSKEDAIAQIKESFKDDPVFAEMITDVIERTVETDGVYESELHDTATKKIELTITSADYVKMCDSNFMRKTMTSVVDQQFATLSDEEKAAKVDEMLEQVKKVYTDINLNVPIVVYTADMGETLVAMNVEAVADGTVDSTVTENGETKTTTTPVNTKAPMSYYRLTKDGTVTHSASMNVLNDDKSVCTIEGKLDRFSDGTDSGIIGMLADSQEFVLTYSKAVVDGARNREVSVYTRSDATSILEPAASDRPLISIRLESKDVDDALLAAVKAATPETSVEALRLEGDEAETFLGALTTNAMQALYAALSKMPPSVLELIGSFAQPK